MADVRTEKTVGWFLGAQFNKAQVLKIAQSLLEGLSFIPSNDLAISIIADYGSGTIITFNSISEFSALYDPEVSPWMLTVMCNDVSHTSSVMVSKFSQIAETYGHPEVFVCVESRALTIAEAKDLAGEIAAEILEILPRPQPSSHEAANAATNSAHNQRCKLLSHPNWVGISVIAMVVIAILGWIFFG